MIHDEQRRRSLLHSFASRTDEKRSHSEADSQHARLLAAKAGVVSSASGSCSDDIYLHAVDRATLASEGGGRGHERRDSEDRHDGSFDKDAKRQHGRTACRLKLAGVPTT